jgi:hypothetical protein
MKVEKLRDPLYTVNRTEDLLTRIFVHLSRVGVTAYINKESTSWYMIFLEKLTVTQLVKKFNTVVQHEVSLLCSLKPAAGPYQFNPVPICYLSKSHFNIILPSTPTSPKWCLLFRFSG